MFKINIKVGNNHTMPIPDGMQKLLEEFFSTFKFDGELNFLLAKKLKGKNNLRGRITLGSIDLNKSLLTITAQPGENNTRHELTTQIPNHIDCSNFEQKIRDKIIELKKPRERITDEERTFQKCLKLFYALDEKLRAGVSERKLHNGDYKTLGYKNFESLYYSILRHAIIFKFLSPEGKRGETIYVWTPLFLAKKDEYEKNHLPKLQEINIEKDKTEKPVTNNNVIETKNRLTSMSEEELITLFSESDDRIKSIDSSLAELRQERTQLTDLTQQISIVLDGKREDRKNTVTETIQKILPLIKDISDEDLLKIFGR